MAIETLRIATRKSPLALWQANHIASLLKQYWPLLEIELVPMVTSGDKFLKDKLLVTGGKGLFVKELEEALLAGEADIAVHSMKDVPATFPEGLALATICKRHNPLDAFIAKRHKRLQELPAGSVIGTSSLRRQSQLLALRSDLEIKVLRGNINTRLNKLEEGEYDAIILAVAGLERMEMQTSITEILSDELMLPACGQGALGIECRAEDSDIKKLLTPLNDPLSALCVYSERHVNALLGGNCHVPLAVFCTVQSNQQLLLRAKVLTIDGQTVIQDRQSGPQSQAIAIADTCAKALLAKGAGKLLSLSS
ncbi:hydroxymethylbilane synthase [Legionella feeleii]|uniref:Porphobilinogen deaminase n=1 Tax=Legionella feeleii TaxID=453 RepID=A0A0W0THN0_9GAMM|nr:hydroxymethylbilane synthase [Legionella feeleii]KTC95096.1 porphobilinogen deaminase [Legionella feeleii]SPX61686.1 porphobilinogen deaminase [Legionella feeleii]